MLDNLTGSLNCAGLPSGPALTPACGAGAFFSVLQEVIIAVMDVTTMRATRTIVLCDGAAFAFPISGRAK